MILPNTTVAYYQTNLYKGLDGKGLDGLMSNFYYSPAHFWLSHTGNTDRN